MTIQPLDIGISAESSALGEQKERGICTVPTWTGTVQHPAVSTLGAVTPCQNSDVIDQNPILIHVFLDNIIVKLPLTYTGQVEEIL